MATDTTVITRDKKQFQQLVYQMAQIPTLQLSSRQSDVDALPDLRRSIQGAVARMLETARQVTGLNRTAIFEFDRLSAQILGIKLESTIIAPTPQVRVWVAYRQVFDSSPQELYLELQPSLYFTPHEDF